MILRRKGLLFALGCMLGPGERNQRKPEADHGENDFNGHALVIGKMVFSILANKRGPAAEGEKHEHQAGCLQPQGIKGATEGNNQGFAAGERGLQKPVFLYNGLQRIFDSGNFRHFAYCSLKIGVCCLKNKTPVTSGASNIEVQRSLR